MNDERRALSADPANDYAHQFLAPPQGQAMAAIRSAPWRRPVAGSPNIGASSDARAADLLERESDPRSTFELLPDWERAWGLPDPCFPDATNIDARQKMLVLKTTLLGGQSRAFYEWVANWLGYTITIREWSPFMAGVSEAGDTRDASGIYRWEIGPPEMRFYWQVHVTGAGLIWFRASAGQAGVDPHLRNHATRSGLLAGSLEAGAYRNRFLVQQSNPDDPMAGTP